MGTIDTSADDFTKQVGARLKAARLRANLSLQSVASHFDMSRAGVGHWETGRSPIDISRLRRLASLYDTTVMQLLADELSDLDLLALNNQRLHAAANPLPAPRKRAAQA